ncbi:hypothetical protein GCM10023063_29180 [Arthrobacter methylotrophus]
MVSRIFFWRTVRLLGAFCGCWLRGDADPLPVAFAAMFANALPFGPFRAGRLPGLRPEMSDPPVALIQCWFLHSNVGQAQAFIKHLF